MTKIRIIGSICLIAWCGMAVSMPVAAQSDQNLGRSLYNEGLAYFNRMHYEQAYAVFDLVSNDPRFTEFHPDALFRFAESAIALDRLPMARDALSRFIGTYPRHPLIDEATYHRARLFHLEGQYENALVALDNFRRRYPDSEWIGNAHYWSGEALLNLGNFAEAEGAFTTVVEQYPNSYRVEAARYQLSIIDISLREEELLEILRWSHEEYLALAGGIPRPDFPDDAVATLDPADYGTEIERLRREIDRLKELGLAAGAETGEDGQLRLLELRNQLLDLRNALADRLLDDTQ